MSDPSSLILSLAGLPPSQRTKLLQKLSEEEALSLLYHWESWARPNQLPPSGDWATWLCLAGRGFGKTRVGAEWVRWNVEHHPNKKELRIALVAPTDGDARKVMVEGESGILAVCPPWNKPSYNPSNRQVTWPSGALATTYSAEEPDRLRGPQHHIAWGDEIAAWKKAETLDNLMFGLRLGSRVQKCFTTTPRPKNIVRAIRDEPSTVVTVGSTFDNAANLAPSFLRDIRKKYEGTRLGRQEIYAEILEDTPGALWNRALIERLRVDGVPCELKRVVIGVDPAVTSGENSDSTGIVVVGLGTNNHSYVLRDLTCKLPPIGWATRVVNASTHYQADRVVCEVNNGGDLVENNLRTVAPYLPYKSVHASRGKRVRAEPIASLYEQGYIHHLRDPENPHHLSDMEDQMCNFVPDQMDASPDNMDALVWALTEIYLEPMEQEQVFVYEDRVHISPY
jgi:phage terminase large subunit-like protein